jgi:hypothetical protein
MSSTEPTKKVYTGWVHLATEDPEGPDDILFVVPTDDQCDYEEEDTLAWKIRADIDIYGYYLSVQYFVAGAEMNVDELQAAWLERLYGLGDVKYGVHYSEITGYLWTDEDIMVGGHDLLSELKSYDGKFLYLEIQYSKEARQ